MSADNPILNTLLIPARIGQNLLVGPGAENLPIEEQAVRAILTGAVASQSPGNLPALRASFGEASKGAFDAVRDPAFQQRYNTLLAEAEDPTSLDAQKGAFRQAQKEFPGTRAFKPTTKGGQIALPPTEAETDVETLKQTQEAVTSGLPPGLQAEVGIAGGRPTITAKERQGFPLRTVEQLAGDPEITRGLIEGRYLINQVGEVNGEPVYTTIITDKGKAAAIAAGRAETELRTTGEITKRRERGRLEAELTAFDQGGGFRDTPELQAGETGLPGEGPIGTGLPPSAGIQPGESPAEFRSRLATEQAVQTAEQTQEIQEARGRRERSTKALEERETLASEMSAISGEVQDLVEDLPQIKETDDPLFAAAQAGWANFLKSAPSTFTPAARVQEYLDTVRGPMATRLAKIAGEVRPTDIDVERMVRALPQPTDSVEVRKRKLARFPNLLIALMADARDRFRQETGREPGRWDPETIRREAANGLGMAPRKQTTPSNVTADDVRKAFKAGRSGKKE